MNQSHSPEEKRQDGYVIHKDGSIYPEAPYNPDEHEYPKMLYHKDGRTQKVMDAGKEEEYAHKGFLAHPEMIEEDPENRHKSFHTEDNVVIEVKAKPAKPAKPSPKKGKEGKGDESDAS